MYIYIFGPTKKKKKLSVYIYVCVCVCVGVTFFSVFVGPKRQKCKYFRMKKSTKIFILF